MVFFRHQPPPVSATLHPPAAPVASAHQLESTNDATDELLPAPTSRPASRDTHVVEDEPAQAVGVSTGDE
jgi:hypothetical protein